MAEVAVVQSSDEAIWVPTLHFPPMKEDCRLSGSLLHWTVSFPQGRGNVGNTLPALFNVTILDFYYPYVLCTTASYSALNLSQKHFGGYVVIYWLILLEGQAWKPPTHNWLTWLHFSDFNWSFYLIPFFLPLYQLHFNYFLNVVALKSSRILSKFKSLADSFKHRISKFPSFSL